MVKVRFRCREMVKIKFLDKNFVPGSTIYVDPGSQVKSSHLYLYSAFNNTNCNKALHNIKIGKFVNNVK